MPREVNAGAAGSGEVVVDRTLERGEAVALVVRAGQRLVLSQVEGDQVADLLSFPLGPDGRPVPGERLSMYHSRAVNGGWKLTAPQVLVSTAARDLWAIEHDEVAENYCGGGYCNPRANLRRYGQAGEATCEGGLAAALAPWGIDRYGFTPDTCFNVFMRVDYDGDGRWAIAETSSRPGQQIVLRSELDQLVGLSNCPQVLSPVNRWALKRLHLQVVAPHGPEVAP